MHNKNTFWLTVLALVQLGLWAPAAAFAQQPPWATLMPAKVQRQWYEDHRIYIEVTTSGIGTGSAVSQATIAGGDHFGNRIGNVVPFEIKVFLLEPQAANEREIEVDFSALRRGQISSIPDSDADWALADKRVLPDGEVPIRVSDAPKAVLLKWGSSQYKAQLWEIKLYAQTMRRAQPLPFSVDFTFARELLPAGGLDWRPLTTPEYLVSMSATADRSPDLVTGNTSPVEQERNVVLSFALIAVGLVLVLAPSARSIVPAVRKRFAGSLHLNPVEQVWQVLSPIFATAKAQGREQEYEFSEAQVRDIVRALKQFFGIESWTVEQLWERRFNLDDGELLHSILLPLEKGVLEMSSPLCAKRYGELVERIERLVPKPV